MTNNSVSIRKCLVLRKKSTRESLKQKLTSCSWLPAIKSINENTNTNFCHPHSSIPYSLRQGSAKTSLSKCCVWMNCLLWTSLVWFPEVCLLNSMCRDTHADHGGNRGRDKSHDPLAQPMSITDSLEICAFLCQRRPRKGRRERMF